MDDGAFGEVGGINDADGASPIGVVGQHVGQAADGGEALDCR